MRIIIVDDDTIVAMSLQTILASDPEIDVLALGHDGSDAVRLYEELHPDVVLMDIRMKDMNGLEAATKILEQDKNAKVLLLTTFSDDEYITKALSIGVKGYILKQDFESIIPALKAVALDQSVFGGQIAQKIPLLAKTPAAFDAAEFDLSDKELEIIKEVGLGKSNKEIADTLFLSEGTVRNYISTILLKLDLRDRTQLAVFYHTRMA